MTPEEENLLRQYGFQPHHATGVSWKLSQADGRAIWVAPPKAYARATSQRNWAGEWNAYSGERFDYYSDTLPPLLARLALEGWL